MKRRFGLTLALVVAVFSVWMNARPVAAVAPFKREFEHKYVKEGTPLADAVEEAKCNICHKGENKKERNEYGKALDKLLTKDDREDVEKIQAALEKVDKQKIDPNDPKSQTFGDRIRSGKLPAND